MKRRLLGMVLVLVLGASIAAPAVAYAHFNMVFIPDYLDIELVEGYTPPDYKHDNTPSILHLTYAPYVYHEFSAWVCGTNNGYDPHGAAVRSIEYPFGTGFPTAQFLENSVCGNYMYATIMMNDWTFNYFIYGWWSADTTGM